MMLRIAVVGLMVVFAALLAAQETSWVAEPVALPEGAEDFRLPDEFALSGDEYYIPHNGGILVPVASDAGSRIYYLKGGKAGPVKFPDGKLEHGGHIECLSTPIGVFVVAYVRGDDMLVCRAEGARLIAIKDAKGNDLVVRNAWFPQGGSVPVISYRREADTMETLCALRDDVASPLKDAEGKPVRAYGWAAVYGTDDSLMLVDVEGGTYEEHARTFRLSGDKLTELDIRPAPPVPAERADAGDRCYRLRQDGKIVVYAWNAEGTEARLWLENNGKAEWFEDDSGAIKHGFSQLAFGTDEIFAIGGGAGPVAYRVSRGAAQSLTWPEDADPSAVKLEVHAGSAFLSGKVGEARRFWRLIGNSFKPVITPAGTVFEVQSGAAYLSAAGGHVYLTLGFMGPQAVALLDGATLLPVLEKPPVHKTFPAGCVVMAAGDDVVIAWTETDGEGNEVNHLSLVRKDGGLAEIRPGSKPFPEGHGVFIETEGGIYAQFGGGTVWWIRPETK